MNIYKAIASFLCLAAVGFAGTAFWNSYAVADSYAGLSKDVQQHAAQLKEVKDDQEETEKKVAANSGDIRIMELHMENIKTDTGEIKTMMKEATERQRKMFAAISGQKPEGVQ